MSAYPRYNTAVRGRGGDTCVEQEKYAWSRIQGRDHYPGKAELLGAAQQLASSAVLQLLQLSEE